MYYLFQCFDIWPQMQKDKLGHPVSVLVGHEGPVTYVDFNRNIPNALLSSSFDGTCRIWDANNSAWPPRVMRACPSFGPMKGITRFGGLSGPFNPGQSSKPNTRSLQETANVRSVPVDAANASIEQRLRSSDPPEAAAAPSGAAAATTDQVRIALLHAVWCVPRHMAATSCSWLPVPHASIPYK